jgi:hypothetical protein
MKLATKFAAAGLTVLALAGCSQSSDPNFDANKLKYDVDTRTGICFTATSISGHEASSLSHSRVPCTDEVLKLVPTTKLRGMSAKPSL